MAMRLLVFSALLMAILPGPVGAVILEPLLGPPAALGEQEAGKVELGKRLFFDRRLSGDGTMSCATCHDPEQGFGDGLDISLSYPTTRNWRNAATLYNVANQQLFFHDGRARSLEEQALFPMMSAFEMNQNLDFLEEEIRAVPEYVADFQRVFGDADVTRQRIGQAIAAFERTIVSSNTPLDRHLSGEKDALSPEAAAGLQIFTGKGGCVKCHFGTDLRDGGFHALLVPENPEQLGDPRVAATRRFVAKVSGFADYRSLDQDPGRYLVTKDKQDWQAFKTPTLREVASTAPYMHNGTFATLAEAVDFFAAGGGPGNRALQPLALSPEEKTQLIRFLEEALTGEKQPFVYPKIY